MAVLPQGWARGKAHNGLGYARRRRRVLTFVMAGLVPDKPGHDRLLKRKGDSSMLPPSRISIAVIPGQPAGLNPE